jgi:hypothetical protein
VDGIAGLEGEAEAEAMNAVSVGAPLRVGDALIIPLLEQGTRTQAMRKAFWVQGERAAVAVVVRTCGGVQAFSVDGQEQDVPSLLAAFPELGELLASDVE